MREGIYRAKSLQNSKWIEGSLIDSGNHNQVFIFPYDDHASSAPLRHLISNNICVVNPETVCELTGLLDYYTNLIWENDIVKLFDSLGVVKFEAGCFGVYFADGVPWERIKEELPSWTHCSHSELHSCSNDHFVSMWELYWNFNCEEQYMEMLTVQGNVFDNPDLMR